MKVLYYGNIEKAMIFLTKNLQRGQRKKRAPEKGADGEIGRPMAVIRENQILRVNKKEPSCFFAAWASKCPCPFCRMVFEADEQQITCKIPPYIYYRERESAW